MAGGWRLWELVDTLVVRWFVMKYQVKTVCGRACRNRGHTEMMRGCLEARIDSIYLVALLCGDAQ